MTSSIMSTTTDSSGYETAEEGPGGGVNKHQQQPGHKTIVSFDSGFSPNVVCIDCYAQVSLTKEEFLLGQRAISDAQISREGKNIRVTSHIKQDFEHSYKEMYVDITAKLPAFARAILPKFYVYIENVLEFPRSSNAILCINPRLLRGCCAFSETIICDIGQEDVPFTMKVPDKLLTPQEIRKVDHVLNWKDAARDSREYKSVVWKRFTLDLQSDNFFFRNLRGFMLKKFEEAFINIVREVELKVRMIKQGSVTFDKGTCFQGGICPSPNFWPSQGADSIKTKADILVNGILQKKTNNNNSNNQDSKSKRRASSSFSLWSQ